MLTIIVLLILAGITISLRIGEGRILRRAQEAEVEHEKAQLKEELELAILDIRTEKLSQGKSMTRDDLIGLEKIGATMQSLETPAEGEYKYYKDIDSTYNSSNTNLVKDSNDWWLRSPAYHVSISFCLTSAEGSVSWGWCYNVSWSGTRVCDLVRL